MCFIFVLTVLTCIFSIGSLCNDISECGSAFRKLRPHIREVKASEYTEVSSKQEVEFGGTATPINITVSVSTKKDLGNFPLESSKVLDWEEVWPNITNESPLILSHIPDESLSSTLDADFAAEGHQCYPVLPLARIKHASDFTDTFLIQVCFLQSVAKVSTSSLKGLVFCILYSSSMSIPKP